MGIAVDVEFESLVSPVALTNREVNLESAHLRLVVGIWVREYANYRRITTGEHRRVEVNSSY